MFSVRRKLTYEKEPVEDKRIISVRIKRKPELKAEPSLLFSQKEIHLFVTEFLFYFPG